MNIRHKRYERQKNVHILYMLDEYSKYMKARVVNTKHPEDIIKTFGSISYVVLGEI